MRVIYFAFLVFVSCASASPRRNTFFDSDYSNWGDYSRDWGVSSFAGAGSGYFPGAGSGYFPGAFAGAGFFDPAWTFPYRPYHSYVPYVWPYIPKIIPWYEGDNVCKKEKKMKESEEMKEFYGDDDLDGFRYSHKSHSCRGNNEKYICLLRELVDGESCMKKITYTCCDGYVRNKRGPGCVKDDQGPVPEPVPRQPPTSQVRESDKFRYNFVPFQGSSSVEGVPAQ